MQEYTVGEVARFLNLGARTVSKLFDSGKLKGRRLPGSSHRRFTKANILEFIETYKLPTHPDLLEALSPTPTPSIPAQIRLLYSTLSTRLAHCSTDRDTITHLLQFRDDVMKAINDN